MSAGFYLFTWELTRNVDCELTSAVRSRRERCLRDEEESHEAGVDERLFPAGGGCGRVGRYSRLPLAEVEKGVEGISGARAEIEGDRGAARGPRSFFMSQQSVREDLRGRCR